MPTNLADFVYFRLVYDYLTKQINNFGMNLMASFMTWASALALLMVTLWIMIQGYRLITGQSRESLMAMVMNMTRVVIIVTAATTMSVFGSNLHRLFTTDLSTGINQLFTGSDETAAETIDKNLAWTQLALGAIDAVQVAPGDFETTKRKAHAMLIAGLGTASPPMAAGAMLLLYQTTIALFIGLGPLFILCLIFDQTKDLFRKWLLYGIGTIFSMAALGFISSLVLQLTLRVAAAFWSANLINQLTGLSKEGLSSQALQQGGIGLLMTVLIISVPPLAAAFFQGTVGSFMHYSAFGGGPGSRPGPQGQPPGSYVGYVMSHAQHPIHAGQPGVRPQAASGLHGRPSPVSGARVTTMSPVIHDEAIPVRPHPQYRV
ncbi:type IV secretion system protein [Frateuria sp. STR12]|uniref:type IV secretion system protein n=1 Tax=Frateuria hangzhouensis TaxID=2995589 RepID=UPI002260AAC8|nr:type IV secretion system protein [Frateuria sp. STR12]MCX7512380.1 type IV secretion system protein [Frateuria sp. STR12]